MNRCECHLMPVAELTRRVCQYCYDKGRERLQKVARNNDWMCHILTITNVQDVTWNGTPVRRADQ